LNKIHVYGIFSIHFNPAINHFWGFTILKKQIDFSFLCVYPLGVEKRQYARREMGKKSEGESYFPEIRDDR